MSDSSGKPLALVTGSSNGIGYELARLCAEKGFDLVVAADRPLKEVARALPTIAQLVPGPSSPELGEFKTRSSRRQFGSRNRLLNS